MNKTEELRVSEDMVLERKEDHKENTRIEDGSIAIKYKEKQEAIP